MVTWDSLKGNKTYIGLAVGAVVLVAHKFGIPTPYVQIDDSAFLNNLWQLAIAAAVRHGIG